MRLGGASWLAVGAAAIVIASGAAVGYVAGGGSANEGDEPSRSSGLPPGLGDRGPAAWIDRPAHGEVLPTGVLVVNSHATSVDGISSMTMEVNGERQIEPRSGASLEHVNWSFDATTPGTYTIEVWGTTTGGQDTPPSIATVIVVGRAGALPTETEVPAATASPTSTAGDPSTATPTASATAAPTATAVPEPTASATATATPEPTASATATATPEPTATGTAEPTSTVTPTPTATATAAPTSTAVPTSTVTPSPTATPTATASPEPTVCALTPPWLSSPGEGTIVLSTAVTLVWTPNDDCNTNAWQVQLAEDPGFVDVDHDVTVPAAQTSWSAPPLSTCSTWYWRVQPVARLQTWSVTWSFQTDCG